MFIPPDQFISAVTFLRNDNLCGSIGLVKYRDQECKILYPNSRYTYGCLSVSSYTLTIPAENMTESEQGSVWRCAYFGIDNFRSPDVTLAIASKLHV